jgi:hypothetical protein
MSRYRSVDVATWGDAWFRSLGAGPPDAQKIWLFLLTGPFTTNIPGVVLANSGIVAAHFGWDKQAYRDAFQDAYAKATGKGTRMDESASLIWLPNAIKPGRKANRPASVNVVKNWRATWLLVPECPLKTEIWWALKAYTEGISKAYGKAFRDAFPDEMPFPSRIQEQEQEQDLLLTPNPLKGESPKPTPPSRSDRKAIVLNRHRAEAERLWALQEQLRKQAIPRCRPLPSTDDRLTRVAERLEAGATPADCEAVLRQFAERAKHDSSQGQWFNGETNWRPKNFDRQLGMVGAVNGGASKAQIPVEHKRMIPLESL